jgi:hypothetical protein
MIVRAAERVEDRLPVRGCESIMDVEGRIAFHNPKIEQSVVTEAFLRTVHHQGVAEWLKDLLIKAHAIRHAARMYFEMVQHSSFSICVARFTRFPLRKGGNSARLNAAILHCDRG